MKHSLLATFMFCTAICVFGGSAMAQRNITPAVERDPIMEADAKHNLDVARQAFTPLKQAYKQVLSRFEETYAAYPDFSQIDEFLYLAGVSSFYLSENKGKQKVDLKSDREKTKYAPAKLRKDAETYLNLLITKYPQSQYREKAEDILKQVKAAG